MNKTGEKSRCMKANIFLILGIFGILLMELISAIPQDFNLNGKLTNSAGTALSGIYIMNFTIYDNATGGNALWSSGNLSVTTDSNGVYTARLSSINLNFSNQYYLGIKVASDSEMTPRINFSSAAYAFRAQNISVSGIGWDGNVIIGNNNFSVNASTFFVDVNNGRVGITHKPARYLKNKFVSQTCSGTTGPGRSWRGFEYIFINYDNLMLSIDNKILTIN